MDEKVLEIMDERFGYDTLLSVATTDGNIPSVRIVDSYYENGAFYIITDALSNKMKQISANSHVAVCGEWFSAQGIGENLGWILDDKNVEIISKLRVAFAEWYDNGHIDEDDKNTCLLRITLTDGVLFSHGEKYVINFNDK